MHIENFWYKLIEAARKKDIILDGLTVPFIVGAYEHINPGFVAGGNAVQKLLAEIAASGTEEKAVLKYSPNNQYIITLRDAAFCKAHLAKQLVFKNKKRKPSLYATTEVAFFGNTIEAISKALNEEYKTFMARGTFSWDDKLRGWQTFSDAEMEVINEAANQK